MRYLVANWKQNMNRAQIIDFFYEFSAFLKNKSFETKIIICPSYVHLSEVSQLVSNLSNVFVGAQDVSIYENGAHTGKVGANQIFDYADYSIIGHSELSDSFDDVLSKKNLLVSDDLVPIICYVADEIFKKLYDEDSIMAWEDPDNISKSGYFNSKDPKEVENYFKSIKSSYPNATILYGGSVNKQVSADLANIPELDGFLVGSASLDPQHFFQLLIDLERK